MEQADRLSGENLQATTLKKTRWIGQRIGIWKTVLVCSPAAESARYPEFARV
jgi:hypothetical protein